jgi:hypothetical protein
MSSKMYSSNKIASGLSVNTDFLDIYIPKIGAGFEEQDVKNIFFSNNLGNVVYVDFVEIVPKPPTNPVTTSTSNTVPTPVPTTRLIPTSPPCSPPPSSQRKQHAASNIASQIINSPPCSPPYSRQIKQLPAPPLPVQAPPPLEKQYSAFVRLSHWYKADATNSIRLCGSYKFYVSRDMYWLLLPAKTPLPRTRLNIHQLASYYNEMNVKIDAQAIIFTEQDTRIEQQSEIIAKQAEQIASLLEQTRSQSDQIAEQSTSINRLFELCEFQHKQVGELQYALSMMFSTMSQNNHDDYDQDQDEYDEQDEQEQPDLKIEDLDIDLDLDADANIVVHDIQESMVSHDLSSRYILNDEDTDELADIVPLAGLKLTRLSKYPPSMLAECERQNKQSELLPTNFDLISHDEFLELVKDIKNDEEEEEQQIIDETLPKPGLTRRESQYVSSGQRVEEVVLVSRSRTPSPENRRENSRSLCGNA